MKHSLDLILAGAAERQSLVGSCECRSKIANVRSNNNHGSRNTTRIRQRAIGSRVAQHHAGLRKRPALEKSSDRVVRTPAEIVDKMIAMLQ